MVVGATGCGNKTTETTPKAENKIEDNTKKNHLIILLQLKLIII